MSDVETKESSGLTCLIATKLAKCFTGWPTGSTWLREVRPAHVGARTALVELPQEGTLPRSSPSLP